MKYEISDIHGKVLAVFNENERFSQAKAKLMSLGGFSKKEIAMFFDVSKHQVELAIK